MENKIQEL